MTQPLTTQPRITLLQEVATGPLSVVFCAERGAQGSGDRLAVKMLRRRTPGDVENLVRLRDDARELARLQHRHIVCAQDTLQVGPFVALASPWVDGMDLLDWFEVLHETGTLLPGRVICELIRSCAVALDAALNATPVDRTEPLRRVHRDIRPTNLMITRMGELKVLDFGTGFTALAGRSARAGALQKGLIKYMSPERREGKRGGPPADVYSLGILAIELFRGRWLRRLRSSNPAHDRHLAEVVARLGDLGMRSSADEIGLRNLLLRMVAFDPEARPPAAEVASTFRTLADRSEGPSLEAFAHTHVVPWLETPARRDEAVGDVAIRLLDTGSTTDDVPIEHDLAERTLLGGPPRRSQWVETDEGWRQQGDVEIPDELVDPYLDDEEETGPQALPDVLGTTIPPRPPPPTPPPPPLRAPAPPAVRAHARRPVSEVAVTVPDVSELAEEPEPGALVGYDEIGDEPTDDPEADEVTVPIPDYERVKVDTSDFGDAPTSQDLSRLQSVVPADRKGRIEARLDRQATEAFRIEMKKKKQDTAGPSTAVKVGAVALVLGTGFVMVAVVALAIALVAFR